MHELSDSDPSPLGRIAVLVDFENIGDAELVERILRACNERGTAISTKAIGDWSNATKKTQRALVAAGADLVHQVSNGKGKNSSDVRIVIEAMDVLHDPRTPVDSFAFATSDADFVPIVGYLRSRGKRVVVLPGTAPLSTALAQVADEVLKAPKSSGAKATKPEASDANVAKATESKAGAKSAKPHAPSARDAGVPDKTKRLILSAVDEIQASTQEPSVDPSTLAGRIREQQPDFSSKLHGFKTFKSLLQAIPELVQQEANGQGPYKVSRR